MTTPNDARPVATVQIGTFGGVHFVPQPALDQLPKDNQKHNLYTATDYESLRSEVERLRADCAAYAGIAVKLAAAEARIRAARKLTSNRFSVSATDIRAVLNGQVNALGDEGNG